MYYTNLAIGVFIKTNTKCRSIAKRLSHSEMLLQCADSIGIIIGINSSCKKAVFNLNDL